MKNNTTNNTSGGIGFFGLLTVLFIGLKLTGYINWSWLWILAPLWGPAVTILILAFLIAVGLAVKNAIKK